MSLCPFIKDTCKGNQCMMWKDESCLVVNFMDNFQKSFAIDLPDETELRPEDIILSQRQKEFPDILKMSSPEVLVSEYFSFIEQEFPDFKMSNRWSLFDLFLKSIGVEDGYGLPSEIQMNIEKLRVLIENEYRKKEKAQVPYLSDNICEWLWSQGLDKCSEHDVRGYVEEQGLDISYDTRRTISREVKNRLDQKRKERIELEKTELISLIDNILDWARVKNFKHLTKSDVDAFLLERDLDVMKETKDYLYAMANAKLKTG